MWRDKESFGILNESETFYVPFRQDRDDGKIAILEISCSFAFRLEKTVDFCRKNGYNVLK